MSELDDNMDFNVHASVLKFTKDNPDFASMFEEYLAAQVIERAAFINIFCTHYVICIIIFI